MKYNSIDSMKVTHSFTKYIVIMLLLIIIPTYLDSVYGFPDKSIQAIKEQKHVLIFVSGDNSHPWMKILVDSIYKEFNSSSNAFKIILHTEYTGLLSFFDNKYLFMLRDLYKLKYASQKIDLIITGDNLATSLMIQYGDELFKDTPIVFISETGTRGKLSLKPNMTGIVGSVKIEETLDLALKLHPKTKHVAVISGSSKSNRFYERKARKIFEDYESRCQFIYLTDLSIDKLCNELQKLPENTIIFYLFFSVDATGRVFLAREIIPQVAHYANKPIYSLWEGLIGSGIVGGYLTTAEVVGSRAVEMGIRILRGENPDEISNVTRVYKYIFDWRELKKWDIDESDLPPNSEIRYKQVTLWGMYRWHIISYALAVLLMGIGYVQYRTISFEKKINEQILMQKSLEKRVEERTADLKKANEELERISQLDGLTSLHNRRFFEIKLDEEWKRLNRSHLPMSLIMCDIDYFKKYNDYYGHLKGDDCLKRVAETISKHLKRPSDVGARYGGEEFAIILSETDSDGALAIAQAIKDSIEQLNIEHSASLVKPIISMSFGIASMIPEQKRQPKFIVSLADQALYYSKEKGRDRISVF